MLLVSSMGISVFATGSLQNHIYLYVLLALFFFFPLFFHVLLKKEARTAIQPTHASWSSLSAFMSPTPDTKDRISVAALESPAHVTHCSTTSRGTFLRALCHKYQSHVDMPQLLQST